MTNRAILTCTTPTRAHWQLGPLPPASGDLILVGWSSPDHSNDAGVPGEVGKLLAGCLTSIARITFPVSEPPSSTSASWSGGNDDQARSLGADSLLQRAQQAWQRIPSQVILLSTRRKETATRLFEDPGFPWHLQGQIALLSPLEAAPPEIDRRFLLSLMGDDWTARGVDLRSIGVTALLRPGVDGDVAGVLALIPGFKEALLNALALQTGPAGFDWSNVSEAAFADGL